MLSSVDRGWMVLVGGGEVAGGAEGGCTKNKERTKQFNKNNKNIKIFIFKNNKSLRHHQTEGLRIH